MAQFKNVSPLGALDIPALGHIVEADEVFEVGDDLAPLFAAQSANYQPVGAPSAPPMPIVPPADPPAPDPTPDPDPDAPVAPSGDDDASPADGDPGDAPADPAPSGADDQEATE